MTLDSVCETDTYSIVGKEDAMLRLLQTAGIIKPGNIKAGWDRILSYLREENGQWDRLRRHEVADFLMPGISHQVEPDFPHIRFVAESPRGTVRLCAIDRGMLQVSASRHKEVLLAKLTAAMLFWTSEGELRFCRGGKGQETRIDPRLLLSRLLIAEAEAGAAV